MRRIICAATAKKCARFCQRTAFQSINRTYASLCRCLQQVIRALSTHVTFREAVEFGVNKRRYPGQGRFVAVSPRQQEFSEFVSPGFVHLETSGQVVQKRREFITGWALLSAISASLRLCVRCVNVSRE